MTNQYLHVRVYVSDGDTKF